MADISKGAEDAWNWGKGAMKDAWKVISGRSDWNEKAPMLDRGGRQGIDQAAQAQQGFSGYLNSAALGQGPTAAQDQFRKQSEMGQAAARGMAAGNTSGNAGLALGAAARGQAMAQGQAAADAGMLRAKEQQAAMQLNAQNLAQQRQQAFQEAAANQGSILTNQGYSAGISAGNAQRASGGLGGVLAAAGGVGMLMSDERAKMGVQETSAPPTDAKGQKAQQEAYYKGLEQKQVDDAWTRLQQMAEQGGAARAGQEAETAAAWQRLQAISDRQRQDEQAQAAAAEAARDAQAQQAWAIQDQAYGRSGIYEPPIPERAQTAIGPDGRPLPKDGKERAEERGVDYGEIMKMAGGMMKSGSGGDAMGGIRPYQGNAGGGGTNYFSGGGYDPLSDIRAKTDARATFGAASTALERQRAAEAAGDAQRDVDDYRRQYGAAGSRAEMPTPGASAVGDFRDARGGGGPAPGSPAVGDFSGARPRQTSIEEDMAALDAYYRAMEAKKSGEMRALEGLDKPAWEAPGGGMRDYR